MKFKNLRRPSRSAKAGITISSKKPVGIHSTSSGSGDSDAYERNIEFLQRSFHSKKWTVSAMSVLLDKTAKQQTLDHYRKPFS